MNSSRKVTKAKAKTKTKIKTKRVGKTTKQRTSHSVAKLKKHKKVKRSLASTSKAKKKRILARRGRSTNG